MSLGYAEKLSYIEDVGNVGMTEYFDPPHVLQEKVETLSLPIHVLSLLGLFLFFCFFSVLLVCLLIDLMGLITFDDLVWYCDTHECNLVLCA